MRRSGAVICGRVAGASAEASRSAAAAAVSCASPRLRTATVGITGTPSAEASAAGSNTSPSRSARSTMFSATTVGQAKLEHFLRENQMLFEVRGIEHLLRRVGLRLPGHAAEHDIARHFLIGA